MAVESGRTNQAINRRMANTRPRKSGGTLDCQMAWLEPLTTGAKRTPMKLAAIQTGVVCAIPNTTAPNEEEPSEKYGSCTMFRANMVTIDFPGMKFRLVFENWRKQWSILPSWSKAKMD